MWDTQVTRAVVALGREAIPSDMPVRRRAWPAAVLLAAVGLCTAAPAAADHDPWATYCRYNAGTRTVVVHLATSHVVQLHTYEGRINFVDLTNYQNKGRCGAATIRNTDRIKVTEETPGDSRLQLRHTWGLFAPGYSAEPEGIREIEFALGTLTQLWVLGRPVVANRVVLGASGIAFTSDGDADAAGNALREVSVFGDDGNDLVSARGGYGTGAVWSGPAGVHLAAYGDDGDDKLYGAAGRDILMGDAGSDILRGYGGSDDLDGGTGSDQIYGNGGNDYIRGGYWSDKMWAGPGDDFIEADDATADQVDGGTGKDLADLDVEDTATAVEATR